MHTKLKIDISNLFFIFFSGIVLIYLLIKEIFLKKLYLVKILNILEKITSVSFFGGGGVEW